MKKLIIYLAILGLAAPALAGARTEASVNASSTIKLGPVIKKINLDARGDASTTVKARVEQIKSAISEHKGEIKEKARGRWGEKAQMHLGNILEHFDRSVDKLENASMRLETQIGKLKVQGLAMASSTDLLARADADIEVAAEKGLAVSAAFDAALASPTPKEYMGAVRTAIEAAQDALRQAARSLMAVIRSIRLEVGAGADVE